MFIIILIFFLSRDIFCDTSENKTNVECVMKVYRKSYEPDIVTINSKDDYVFENSSVTIMSIKNKTNLKNTMKYRLYLVVLEKIDEMKKIYEFLYNIHNWNPRAKYIFVYKGKEDIDPLFKISWHYFVVNMIVVHNQNIFTYFPYETCEKIKPYRYFASCEDDTILNYFPPKVPKDLNGCEVKMLAYDIPPYVINSTEKWDPRKAGIEVVIINTVAERMNFSGVYGKDKFLHWGYLMPDGSSTFMLKSLQDRNVDLIFGMAVGNVTLIRDFDLTRFHLLDAVTWFVPAASQIAHWKHIAMIFKFIVWVLIFCVFLVNGFSWWIAGRKSENASYYNDLIGALVGSWHVLLQGCIKPPNERVPKMLYLTWSIGSMLLFAALQSQLISILTKPLYERQISTLEELATSGLNVGFFDSLANIYSDPTNKIHKIIYSKYIACPLTEQCLNRTAFKRDFAVIKNKKQALYLTPKYYTDSNGKSLLFPFSEVVVPILPSYCFVKGHPLLDRIEQFLLLFHSNGLFFKWEHDIAASIRRGENSPEQESLKLGHLQSAFFLLSFGHLISFVAFSVEIFHNKFKCKRKKVK